MAKNDWAPKLRAENKALRNTLRTVGLTLVAIADNIGDEVVEQINMGRRMKYSISAEEPVFEASCAESDKDG